MVNFTHTRLYNFSVLGTKPLIIMISRLARINTRVTFTRSISMKGEVNLSSRRELKKIEVGKARPTIFHQFETLVELSDGSVISRWSQAPKDEIRMIADQRNSTLWNPHRSDLSVSDPNATGKISKFNQRFADFEPEANDDLVELMANNVSDVKLGGNVFDKKSNRNR